MSILSDYIGKLKIRGKGIYLTALISLISAGVFLLIGIIMAAATSQKYIPNYNPVLDSTYDSCDTVYNDECSTALLVNSTKKETLGPHHTYVTGVVFIMFGLIILLFLFSSCLTSSCTKKKLLDYKSGEKRPEEPSRPSLRSPYEHGVAAYNPSMRANPLAQR
ncbi:hypothetical protein ADUPG1_013903 [Aduncisulcus paluster]|uniref:Uncharacterized protein n=1 Tax=Aduncisulcus paluster TaxID=2918883 RepID=A0ABQ5K4T1_9EUKA|nr:hypothetical protein ADUPG1_013903 [Aduncisulcus paluster]